MVVCFFDNCLTSAGRATQSTFNLDTQTGSGGNKNIFCPLGLTKIDGLCVRFQLYFFGYLSDGDVTDLGRNPSDVPG